MSEKRRFTQLEIYDFGPFKEAKIELAPLTIFIGKNALGKSMLLYLIWILESTIPDLRRLYQILDEKIDIDDVLEGIFEGWILEGIDQEKLLTELLIGNILYFPMVWAEDLKNNLHATFGTKLSDLIRSGANKSKILIKGSASEMEISINLDELSAKWLKLDDELIKRNVKIEVEGKIMTITFKDRKFEKYVDSPADIANAIGYSVMNIIYGLYPGIGGSSEGYETLLVDGRAGIARTLFTAYPGVGLAIRDILRADYHFVDSIYRLAKDYLGGKVDLNAPVLKSLLRELNSEFTVEEEFGIPKIYIKAIGNKWISLDKSPSGIREIMPLLLGLLSRNISILYVEEPETHLHPRAVMLIPRLMAYALNKLDKKVRLTTHSDNFIMAVNNLIALSSNPEGAKELGYSEEELIEPDMVRAYLLKKADDHVEVVELPVMEDGFDESAFEEVAEELFRERSEVMRLLEEKKSR